ncbi:MAG: glycosyltransferase, partial [Candidatus Aenigmarchaeota archaeon]|nr:glycosyltransferase [Candidatus Aenigmarchaeota archaeon]
MVFGLFDILTLFCYIVMIYCSVLWLLVLIKNRDKFREDEGITHSHPSVTVLVPAYNEEKHIKKSINSILSINYPKTMMKIICINDGSTDN